MSELNDGLENHLHQVAPSDQAFRLARHALKLASEGRIQSEAIEELQGVLRRISKEEGAVDHQ